VALTYGTVTAEGLIALKAVLYEKLASPASFLTHADLFAERSTRIRINLEEVRAPTATALFAIFEETICMLSFYPWLV
jgi:hypothetical protein